MTITDKNYKNIIENNDAVIKFGAPWCGPCRQIDPIIKKMEAEETPYVIGSVDVDDNSEISTEFGIRSIPAILIFKEGKVVDKIVGFVPENQIREKIAAALN